jgi:hypothetical protein
MSEGIYLKMSPEERPATLGGSYLHEAIEALEDSGNPVGLYSDWFRSSKPEGRDKRNSDLEMARAGDRRTALSRRVILYAAFAAESFINEFMSMHFAGSDLRTLDRLPTAEKYALAPRLALGRELFDRSREPLQTIARLFRLRDMLVHPKPGRAVTSQAKGGADPLFNPGVAASMLVAAAEGAEALLREATVGDKWNMWASSVAIGREGVIEFGRAATEALPGPDDEHRYVPLSLEQSRLPKFERSDPT